MFTAYKAVAIASGVVLYISSYLVGSLPLVLGTSAALAGLVISITQLRDR
jgi:hypothetical protein